MDKERGTRENEGPTGIGYQYLENIATGYWHSQVLFTAIELRIFTLLETRVECCSSLAARIGCREEDLSRLLRALEKLGLVERTDRGWQNGCLPRRYLVADRPDYMGDFFLYRQYMLPNWLLLTERVGGRKQREEDLDYEARNFRYVRAMDGLARQKAREIAAILAGVDLSGPVLDVGGGAGSLLRALRDDPTCARSGFDGELFDIPEVIAAARSLYPGREAWEKIAATSGDFRSHGFRGRYRAVILSNLLHIYSPDEAGELLDKAMALVEDGGLLIIHDYFPDRKTSVAEKGALYDLCMLLNTHNGVCHEAETVCTRLRGSGFEPLEVRDLATDSSLIIAARSQGGGISDHGSRRRSPASGPRRNW